MSMVTLSWRLTTLIRQCAACRLTSTREIDSIILRAESFACKDSQRWNSDSRGTLAREYTDLKLPVLP